MYDGIKMIRDKPHDHYAWIQIDNLKVYERLFIRTIKEGLGKGEIKHYGFHVEFGKSLLKPMQPPKLGLETPN